MDHEFTQRSVRERVPARVWRVRCEATSVFCFFVLKRVFLTAETLGQETRTGGYCPKGFCVDPVPQTESEIGGLRTRTGGYCPKGSCVGHPPSSSLAV